MASIGTYPDIDVALDDRVATVTIRRPPFNYFDVALINAIADALAEQVNLNKIGFLSSFPSR